MRKPFLIFVTALAFAISIAAYLLHLKQNSPRIEKTETQSAENRPFTNIHGGALRSGKQQRHHPEFPGEIGAAPEQEKYEAYVAEKIASLADLGMESDPASLDLILSELANPDAEIRSAAREAAVQFGSREAIPAMQNAMLQVDDPEEKAALAKGIHFLELTNFIGAIDISSGR